MKTKGTMAQFVGRLTRRNKQVVVRYRQAFPETVPLQEGQP